MNNKSWPVFILSLMFSSAFYGATNESTSLNYQEQFELEKFILNVQLDSAYAIFPVGSKSAVCYDQVLENLKNSEPVQNSAAVQFFCSIAFNESHDAYSILEFFNKNIKPNSYSTFDFEFVKVSWMMATRLREEGIFEESKEVDDRLREYVSKFDPELEGVVKASILLQSHEVIMNVIQENVEEGMSLVESMLEKSVARQDTDLIIISNYFKCDFLILQQKLEEYIEVSRYNYDLDNSRNIKSPYYFLNIQHLLDALIFQGKSNQEALDMLVTIYRSPKKESSFMGFAKLIRYLPKNDPMISEVLNLFEVNSMIELFEKFETEAKSHVYFNDYFHILNESRCALHMHGFKDHAFNYATKTIVHTKEIYSTSLSESIAKFQSEKMKQAKDAEIQAEKQRSEALSFQRTLYLLLVLLSVALCFVVTCAYVKMRRKKSELETAYQLVEEQKDIIQENIKVKDTLLKEIHHRVKNNFQIMSSLLNVQSEDVDQNKIQEIIEASKYRIASMQMIHEKLHTADSLMVNLYQSIAGIVEENKKVFGSDVEFKLEMDRSHMCDIDVAVPLGLILNELITNMFKHARTEGSQLVCQISVAKKQDQFILTFKDNGPGVAKDANLSFQNSIGLKLMRSLSAHINGSMEYQNNQGAEFIITFMESKNQVA